MEEMREAADPIRELCVDKADVSVVSRSLPKFCCLMSIV